MRIREQSDVNVAVIGLGRMGEIFARAIAEMDGARLAAVASEDVAEKRALLDELNVAERHEAAGSVFQSAEIDAVVIATPTSTHRNLVLSAAAAGKAVFCEKPLALNLEDTRRMIGAAEKAGVLLQVGFMRRFDAAYVEARSAIQQGRIGRPTTFKAVGRDPFCPDPAYADPAHSGGLIVDMAIHDIDLARWLMGSEIERVTAEAGTLVCDDLERVGDFDNAVVNLRFENGAIGNVEVSRTAFYGYDIRTEIVGSKAALRIGHDHIDSAMLLEPRVDAKHGYLVRRFGEAYRTQIRDFVACVSERREPRCTGFDALAAFEVSLAATYAAQTRRSVTVADVRAGWTPAVESD